MAPAVSWSNPRDREPARHIRPPVPALVVPAALLGRLAQLTELFALMLGPVETLPYLLRDAALHAIEAARAVFG